MQEVILKQEEIENIIIDDEKKDEKKTLTKLPEHRCKRCNRLLFYGNVKYVEIKCPFFTSSSVSTFETPTE